MKKIFLMIGALILVAVGIKAQTNTSISGVANFFLVDVPATTITVPADRPCNISPRPDSNGFVPAVCITGPETLWTCADKYRVLLMDESGTRHCINFGTIQSYVNNSYVISVNTQKLENK